MKRIWKVLMGAAAIAAVAPYRVEKDEETGAIGLKAATWSGTYTREGKNVNVTVHPLPGIIKAKDCECDEDDECGCGCCREEEPEKEEEDITIEVVEEPAEEEASPEEPPEDPNPQEA